MTAVDRRQGVDEFLADLCDGPLCSWDAPAGPPPVDSPTYRDELAAAAARSGHDESVRTGEARIGGHRIAVIAGEFAFLAGSVGVRAADRIVAAIERATAAGLPLLGVTASGGTRMQEGAPAFLRMAGIAAAIAQHRRAGLLYLTYLRHPTTGGVLASWGSLGHVTFAEPGALVGFLGPKVYAALHGVPFPAGVQTAEHLHRHGLVDAVVAPQDLRATVRRLLDLHTAPAASPLPAPPQPPPTAPDAWTCVTATRDPARPGLREVLRHADGVVELAPAPGAVLALARFGGTSCVLVGHDRTDDRPAGPAALRLVLRAAELATELALPLVTVVDTAGGELSVAAEEQGTAQSIARCLATLSELPVPSVSVLLGQGAGGAALALLPADRVLAARHSWLAPVPPEGASAVLHGTVDRAAELAAAQHIRAVDLGVADAFVDDGDLAAFPAGVAVAIGVQLRAAAATTPSERRTRRRLHPR
jgi:acetyl-CoA carboxylase beta subunit/acetyl-CoA carboxylase alpha subunit